ncbi:MAG: 2-oxo acid dehydrogenase subunit E2, partial [Paracoccaceae bacterium]
MPTEILMPALSPTMEEGTLIKWMVSEGDNVAAGDILAEIETDKATMEFEAVDEGVIGRILVAEGTEGVAINAPIAILLAEGESADDIGDAPAEKSARPAPAPADAPAKPAKPRETAPKPAKDGGTRIFATPLARRMAQDAGIDLGDVTGSGPNGRIIKADIIAAQSAPRKESPAKTGDTDAVTRLYEGREYQEIALTGMRRTIAARLTESKQTIPHYYLRRDIRIDALEEFRGQLNARLEGRGVKISLNDLIVKACAMALQAVPDANVVWAGDRILRMKASDVAVAVALADGGLYTPVLLDADSRSLSSLSQQMKDLAARARDHKLAPQEYLGGSFAISNLGMF